MKDLLCLTDEIEPGLRGSTLQPHVSFAYMTYVVLVDEIAHREHYLFGAYSLALNNSMNLDCRDSLKLASGTVFMEKQPWHCSENAGAI